MSGEGTASTLLTMLRDGPRQAQDLAHTLGIDTSAVRRHLEGLRAAGMVDAEDVIDGPGRPKKMYRISAQGRETFPRDYARVLGLLLETLEGLRGRPEVESLVGAMAGRLGSDISTLPTQEARLAALLRLYNDLGFEAELTKGRDGAVLTQRNCIVLRTARDDPDLLCACFDEGIMRAALPGATITLERTLARGDAACRHRLAPGPPGKA